MFGEDSPFSVEAAEANLGFLVVSPPHGHAPDDTQRLLWLLFWCIVEQEYL